MLEKEEKLVWAFSRTSATAASNKAPLPSSAKVALGQTRLTTRHIKFQRNVEKLIKLVKTR